MKSLDLADSTVALDACVASLGLALLPKAAARVAVANRVLRRVEGPSLQPARLYALRRPFLVRDRAQSIVEALTQTVRRLAEAS